MHPVLLVLLLLFSCSGGRKLMDGERRLLSHHARPAWVDAPELAGHSGIDVYCGISGDATTEHAAREAAQANARQQAMVTIGHEAGMLVDRVIDPLAGSNGLLTPAGIQDGLSRLIVDGIDGEEILKWHIQRWETFDNGVTRKYFTAHCLLAVPDNEAHRLVVELLETRAQGSEDPSVHAEVGLALKALELLPDKE